MLSGDCSHCGQGFSAKDLAELKSKYREHHRQSFSKQGIWDSRTGTWLPGHKCGTIVTSDGLTLDYVHGEPESAYKAGSSAYRSSGSAESTKY